MQDYCLLRNPLLAIVPTASLNFPPELLQQHARRQPYGIQLPTAAQTRRNLRRRVRAAVRAVPSRVRAVALLPAASGRGGRFECERPQREPHCALLTRRLHADAEILKNGAEHDPDAAARELCVGCLGQLQMKLRDDRGESLLCSEKSNYSAEGCEISKEAARRSCHIIIQPGHEISPNKYHQWGYESQVKAREPKMTFCRRGGA